MKQIKLLLRHAYFLTCEQTENSLQRHFAHLFEFFSNIKSPLIYINKINRGIYFVNVLSLKSSFSQKLLNAANALLAYSKHKISFN